jgi:drug/metabolite transporter (DMT)-like permease
LKQLSRIPSIRAELILVFVAAIWGGTFVIIKLTLLDISPFSFLTIRFSLASILFYLIFHKKIKAPSRDELIGGLILGVLLFTGFASQTFGLVYTTASKSALITGVNIVIIPFAQYLIIKKKVGIENWIGIIVVLAGLYFLTQPQFGKINTGDAVTLICAISWAFYIIYLDIASRKYSLHLIVFIQFLLVTLFSLIFAISFEKLSFVHFTEISVLGILYTSVLATLVATFLGNKYQKETTPVRAGILFTFEQPSAVIFAMIFLKDTLTTLQLLGGLLMLLGILFSETFEYIKTGLKNSSQNEQ